MKNLRPILLVEDDIIDQMAVKRSIRELDAKNSLIIKENGEEALVYLRQKENEKPMFVLLDLNMPKMGGLELLKILKEDPELKSIPIIILTTSKEDQDRIASFKQSVAGYIVKPVDYEQFRQTLKLIHDYWSNSESPY
jgi:CheY-like chemotaxis protein